MKKRIVPILLCLVLTVAAVALLPENTQAATVQETGNAITANAIAQDGTFPETLPEGTTTHTAYCYACGAEKEWKPITDIPVFSSIVSGDHYYLPTDVSVTSSQTIFNSTKVSVCFHNNGKSFTNAWRFFQLTGGSTLNIMGGGTMKTTTANNRGTLYANGACTLNVYGTTVEHTSSTDKTDGSAAIAQYNTNAVFNLWGCKLVTAGSTVILANGTVNLYNCTVTGGGAQIGGYSGVSDSKAALTVVDSTIPSVKINNGPLAVSGVTQIGRLELAEGKTIDPTGLKLGSVIAVASNGVLTAAGNAEYAQYFSPVNATDMINVSADGVISCLPEGAQLVDASGNQTASDDLLTDWAAGSYSYIKLFGDEDLAMSGQDIVVDLNGYDLTVTGTGTVTPFDSANDSYDGNACGTVYNKGSVTVKTQVSAPNGNTYVAVTEGNLATMHRLEMKLVSVSVRTNAAGIYYKASYTCDDALAKKVSSYGVVLSVNNMPGADFKTESDINGYTVAAAPFKSGVTATSGSVFGIMKESREAAVNDEYAKMPIYVNAYIDLGNGPVVANTAAVGLTVSESGFTGVALSLYDVMTRVDAAYSKYNTAEQLLLDQFYTQWKDKGMDWSFTNIGSTAGATDGVDNSDIELKFDEGTTDAVCPVCKTKVTWTALTDDSKTHNLQGHYYLTGDLTFEGTGDAFFWNGTRGANLCVHLNGHNITATQTRAIHGSSGRTNVMGNGIVTGHQGSSDLGAAAMINNGADTNGIHLYGGTYRKTANSAAKATPVAINTVGGTLNIYEGATIDNPSGNAIIVKAPTTTQYAVKSELGLYGCTVNGNVELCGADPAKCLIENNVELVDCVINGNVNVARYNNVTLGGALKITKLTVDENERVQTRVLTDGASIGVGSRGVFTAVSESVNQYTDYFYGVDAVNEIQVRDNALYCGPDYTGDLVFAEGTTDAMCPVCAKVVTWIPVDGTERIKASTTESHHYLTKDTTFTAGDSGELSFLTAEYGTYNSCFHLNGYNLTAADTRFIYGSTNHINVMGTGTVTGIRNDKNAYGSTIQINTSNENGTVNLYSGIYTQAETGTYAETDYVISISNNGGTVNVYEDAIIRPNSNGRAIYVGTGNLRSSKLGIYGGAVEGAVDVAGATTADRSVVTVDGGDMQGTVTVKGLTNFVVGDDAKIQLLDLPETVLLTMEDMTDGASVTLQNTGTFTQPHANAESYAKYFASCRTGDKIVVKENALCCKPDYEAKVYPNANGVAFCPVCQKEVEWTAISSGAEKVTATAGSHYYLTTDIVYEGVYDGNDIIAFFNGAAVKNVSACLNLNGYDITSTASHGIFGGWGILNVFGSGTVTGKAPGSTIYGGAVQVNNSVAGSGVHLYSGTYRNSTASPSGSYVAALSNVGGGLYIYEDADISNPGGNAIYLGTSTHRDGNLEIYGATIKGNIVTAAPAKTNGDYKGKLIMKEASLAGTLDVASGIEVTLDGKTQITRMNVAAGQQVTFTNMKEGSSVAVSADGIFTTQMAEADEWLQYITCVDAGDHIIVRDKQFYQGAPVYMNTAAVANENDKTALNTTYAGTTLRYGEMHNHTNSGPYLDDGTGYRPSTGADGKNSLEEWIAEMDRLKMDFAFIVDHGMSIHMYKDKFLPDYFIGGTEPGTTITDSKASPKSPHYNMLFAYPEQLESIFFKWEAKFKPMKWDAATQPNALNPSEEGYRILYPSFTTAEFGQLAKDVYDAGGLLVQVHPKYDSYIYSDDPLDYYFADYTGFEISTGSSKSGVTSHYMTYKDNEEAYQTWIDLLEMDKKIWATAGSDRHRLPDISGLSAIYTVNDHKDDYMAAARAGNVAPGWIGIRMNVNGTAMGGETAFAGQRLQFSVGDVYRCENTDYVGSEPIYVEGHTYRVELYDDGGLLMSEQINPTEMNYFAIDCDETAKFYRVVVWDETDNERIGVSNPIWNKTEE